MSKRLNKIYSMLLIFPGLLFCMGCSYLVKNDQHRIYSKAKYGIDKFIVVQDYHIHYVESGEGEPVFLIPGAFSTYRDWNRTIPFLSKYYKLLAIDYLGVGDSDKPRSGFVYTIEEQADLIVRMMDALQISRAAIVGVSYGGGIALNLAARYPEKVKEIVCIEGNGVVKHKKMLYRPMGILRVPVIGDVPIGVIRTGWIDQIIAKWVMGKSWPHLKDEERKEIIEIISQNNKTASRVSWYRISRTMERSKDFSREAKTIQAPILYLYGRNSKYRQMIEENIEFLKAHLPDLKVICMEEGIHDLELQKPEEVANFILDFLKKNRTKE